MEHNDVYNLGLVNQSPEDFVSKKITLFLYTHIYICKMRPASVYRNEEIPPFPALISFRGTILRTVLLVRPPQSNMRQSTFLGQREICSTYSS